MGYIAPGQRRDQLKLVTAEEMGGAQPATLAMMLWLADLTNGYPDDQYVSAFARSERTNLGAALSFGEQGREVRFIGRPVPRARGRRRQQAQAWQHLIEGRPNVAASYRPPQAEDIVEVLRDPIGPWAVKLDIAGSAFPEAGVPFQPSLIIGLQANTLTVHNPGNTGIEPQSFQELDMTEALGLTVAARTRVSMLAVRMTTVVN